MKFIAFALALSIAAVAVYGQKGRIFHDPPHFFTAQQYLGLRDEDRELYAMGVVDGLQGSVVLRADEKYLEAFASCIQGMSGAQMSAIITKYVKDHPEKWNDSLSVNAYSAFMSTCPKPVQSGTPQK
ncbi:MAG: hypothetical protein ACRD59_19300 [Candidatus Acidiferrales bacterium]